MSIRLRLTLWYSGILAITLIMFGTIIYFLAANQLQQETRNKLSTLGQEVISEILIVNFSEYDFFQMPNLNDFKSSGVYLQSYTSDGKRKYSNNLPRPLPFPSEKALKLIENKQGAFETVSVDGSTLLVYHMPMVVNQSLIGILQVATPIDFTQQFLGDLQRLLLLMGIFTILLAATFGWFLARKALRPIDNVIASTARIEKGEDLGKRMEYNGPNDEIGQLVQTINGMLERIETIYVELEQAYRVQRRFVADASHELRTPLTTIRGNIELLNKMWATKGPEHEVDAEAMNDIAAEAERMSRLINDLLSLARADAGQQLVKKQVEVKPLVEEVARRALFLPRTAQWELGDITELERVYVLGDRNYLQQLLFIFIENAFKFTPSGVVKLDAQRIENQMGLRISDTGVGMDMEEVPHIFERFYRADPSRGQTSGTGLGLSIAKWIIDEHSGSIEVMTSKNEGSTFVIWLPILELSLLESSHSSSSFPPTDQSDIIE